MKKRFLWGIIILCMNIVSGNALLWAQEPDPLLVVTLMVKDEAPVMRATLEPFLKAGIDAYLILDTGSSDDTIAVTRALFAEYGVERGVIVEQPFIDFATSRNYALACVERSFPQAAFLLMLDAEWIMHNVKSLVRFCAMYRPFSPTSFLVRIGDASFSFYTPRLMKLHHGIRFEGVVHETLNQVSVVRVPDSIYFELRPTRQGKEKSARRWLRDRDLLLKEHEKSPDNLRTLFYLGQTYACLGDWENAILWYTKRCESRGWDEEDFAAHYKLAQAYECNGNWEQAQCYFEKAIALRPTRAEPFVCLAEHYWQAYDYERCFLYAQQACELAYPQHDLLFIENRLYDCNRFDLLGRAAWYMGEFEMGENAVCQALKNYPDEPHLHANRACYLARKESPCTKPRVSIITSVFNGDAFIEGFMRDIVQQSLFHECELILINANSTGNEEVVIKKYMDRYANIRYVRLDKDPGLYAVWNLGIKMAAADLITNANLDDRRHPQSLAIEAAVLEHDTSVDLVYGDYWITHIPNETFMDNHHTQTACTLDFEPCNIHRCLPGPQPMWRASLHAKYGYFNEEYRIAGDWEMWCRAVSGGARFKKIPHFITGLFYQNPEGLSTDQDSTKAKKRDDENRKILQQYAYLWQ